MTILESTGLSIVKGEKQFDRFKGQGLLIPKLIWRKLENFSTNALCLIASSLPYKEEDYIRDYKLFKTLVNEK